MALAQKRNALCRRAMLTLRSLSREHQTRECIKASTFYVLSVAQSLSQPFSEVIPDGNGDYLLAFKGREDEGNAGVSTRAYGDHFTSTAEIVDGALIQCLPIAEVARMVNNLVDG
eukprot:scaffold3781_cov149-Skeletonema_dohrnii-CCMP3373.AAC.3